ncbi:hypothetical protein [Pseudodesulfovibrio sp. JC047]|nr:hypothetical protein [Pseudodesulfovibrio sp. JC047]
MHKKLCVSVKVPFDEMAFCSLTGIQGVSAGSLGAGYIVLLRLD